MHMSIGERAISAGATSPTGYVYFSPCTIPSVATRLPRGERHFSPVRSSTSGGLRLPEVAVVPTPSGKSRPGAPVQGRRMHHGEAGDGKGGAVTQVQWEYLYRVGIDWASEHHQVCILDRDDNRTEHTVPHTSAGLTALAEKLAALSPETPERVAVALELPRGPVVETLLERGFHVFSLNPKQLDRFP
jgi:hypothetical protein